MVHCITDCLMHNSTPLLFIDCDVNVVLRESGSTTGLSAATAYSAACLTLGTDEGQAPEGALTQCTSLSQSKCARNEPPRRAPRRAPPSYPIYLLIDAHSPSDTTSLTLWMVMHASEPYRLVESVALPCMENVISSCGCNLAC